MKKLPFFFAMMSLGGVAVSSADLTKGMESGAPPMKSVSALTFGPQGILFAADPKGAAVFAIATGDNKRPDAAGELEVEGLDAKVAALLGIGADELLIADLAINPASGNAYLSVMRGKGPDGVPALVRVSPGQEIELVELDGFKHSKLELADAPEDAVSGEGRRRRNKRLESITDLAFVGGQVAIAGLSNEEFASTLRTAAFPFEGGASASSIEIFHGAHGRLETNSPIRTFLPMNIGGEANIIASYTCTPLVTIPLKDLKPKALIKGRTVAELGNRNRPLDMIEYKDGDDTFILIANSSRGIMKVSTENISEVEPISERVGGGGTAGLSYETIEGWDGIVQLDRLGEGHAVVVRQDDNGYHLEQRKLP